jgi:hypothetical protein
MNVRLAWCIYLSSGCKLEIKHPATALVLPTTEKLKKEQLFSETSSKVVKMT